MTKCIHQFEVIDLLLLNDDKKLCQIANKRRLELYDSPSQSNFRVFALVIIDLCGLLYQIEGTNSEPCYIGGSICAERSALVKLRLLPGKWTIKKLVIVTDNSSPISPGLLCREYITSMAAPQTPIILGSNDNEVIIKSTIQFLHPYPYLYNKLKRDEIVVKQKI